MERFDTPDALASWLESLHECAPDGAVSNRKWEAAQVAARAVRGMGQQAGRGDVDAIALEAARDIAGMQARNHSQHVARVQVRIVAALTSALHAEVKRG